MSLRSKLVFTAKVGLVVASSMVVLGVTFYMSVRTIIFGTEMTVPDLVGKTVQQATSIVQPMGLTLETTSGEYDPRVPEGGILSQSPQAGAAIKPKRKIRVIVSRGEKTIEVPDLARQSERTATLAIEKQGLMVGTISRVSAPAPLDQVLAQDPTANSTTFPGEKVNLLVSRGPREPVWVMPDLTGHPRLRVERLLEENGVRIAEVLTEASTAPAGTVLRQQPQAGYPFTRRETVTMVVSGGPGWQPGAATPMIPSH